MLCWSAIHCRSCFEAKVDSALARLSLEHFFPAFSQFRQYANRHSAVKSFPLFPGYTFARLDDSLPSQRKHVAQITGACYILDGVSDTEMNTVRLLASPDYNPLPHHDPITTTLATGTRVTVRSGPLAGLQGVFLQTHRNKPGRLVVQIELLNRSLSVNVDAANVIASPASSSSSLPFRQKRENTTKRPAKLDASSSVIPSAAPSTTAYRTSMPDLTAEAISSQPRIERPSSSEQHNGFTPCN
jgi:transcription antitermination factor NusG